MTVYVNVGRRVPKAWFKRMSSKVMGLISFQENLWMIIKQSFTMAKKKANADGRLEFIMKKDIESEDLHYNLEWIRIIIKGTEEQEQDEYNDTLKMYQPLNKVFKKDMSKDKNMSKHFKSKIISQKQIDKAYKNGYASMEDNNMSNKLLELGILTDIDWVKDFDNTTVEKEKIIVEENNE